MSRVLTAAREVALSISGGDVLAVFLLAPLVLVTLKVMMYVIVMCAFSGGPPSLGESVIIIVVLAVLAALGFGIWDFSHWIVRE